jgi:purine-binding chemotaxis protein CheW
VSNDQTGFSNELQLVSFILGQEEYALDILLVQEIIRMLRITRVPRAPHYIEGVVNLRGNVIPVFDLHRRFGLSERVNSERTRIIVVKVQEIIAGLVVDGVSEVLRLPQAAVEPVSSLVTAVDTDYIQGIGKKDNRLLIMLNINRVLGIEGLD